MALGLVGLLRPGRRLASKAPVSGFCFFFNSVKFALMLDSLLSHF